MLRSLRRDPWNDTHIPKLRRGTLPRPMLRKEHIGNRETSTREEKDKNQ